MSLRSKLHDPSQSILLYGTTPPRASASASELEVAAEKLTERLRALPLDGLVVYDVQDEAGRTALPRPFPFLPTLDSRRYSKRLADLTGQPVVTYKCVAQMDEARWRDWLDEANADFGVHYLSLVGAPTASQGVTLPLSKAVRSAAEHLAHFTLGGVCIAERHAPPRSESQRMIQKAADGCEFFVSQAVYSPTATIAMLRDYALDCQRAGVPPRRVVLTFAPCGRAKTLEFIKWLGVSVPPAIESAILSSPTPLEKSIQICGDILRQILEQEFCGSLPLGVNVESVSINKAEIDGSIEMVHVLSEILAKS